MEQGSSATEQLIYRASYRKHRERLIDIRHNAMLHDFLLPPKLRQEDKKGQMKNKIKHEEISTDNKILQGKINSIKNRNFHQSQQPFSTQEMRKPEKRYDSNNDHRDEGCRFQIKSDFDDNQPVKCILPGSKTRAFSFVSNQKKIDPRTQKRNSLRNNFTSERGEKKFESFNMSRENTHQMLVLLQKQQQPQIQFNLIQRNQNRKVIHKKTIILSSMQSALLQLSLISGRLLVVAYLMGIQTYKIRELFSAKQTKRILKDYQQNYEDLCSRITLEKINDKYGVIKISPKETQHQSQKQVSIEQDINKNKAKLQNEFIKRNYYTLLKKEKEEQEKYQLGKEKPNSSIEKVQALVERLAVPRRYVKDQNGTMATMTKKGDVIKNRVISKPIIPPTKKQQFQREKEKEKNQVIPSKKLPINCNQNQQNHKVYQQQQQKNIFFEKDKQKANPYANIKEKSCQSQKDEEKNQTDEYKEQFQQEDEEVQYLGEDGNNEYDQQFQNPSQMKNHPELKQISEDRSIGNNSSMLKQRQKSKPVVSEKNKSDMYQNIYEEESKNAKEEQNYEEEFQESKEKNKSVVKNKKEIINKQESVNEDYQQEFDN